MSLGPFLLLIFLSLNVSAQTWQSWNLIHGCRIMNMFGVEVDIFPGNFCQFFEDGSYLTANDSSLKYMAKGHVLKWEINGSYHHQLNLSHDRSKILALTSDKFMFKGKEFRQDKFQIISMNGKILHESKAADYNQYIKITGKYSEHEISHFNSFYEIPAILPDRKVPEYLRPGNLILNSYRQGAFIVSPDLKKVLHHLKFNNSKKHYVHDAQILPNGHLLYFNNMAKNQGTKSLFSTIDEIDLATGETQIMFQGQPKELFFSRHCGGVQYLDNEHMLISHMLAGTYIYSLKDKIITKNIYRTHFNNDRFYPVQQIKAENLKQFLKHWK